MQNGVLVFDDENDMDCLLEYLIFHSKFKGTPILDLFYDSDIMLEDTEELILEGLVNSKMHLLEVMDIDRNPDRCRLYMQDLISTDTYEVINQGSAQSSYPGLLVGTSLIEIGNEIFMTSGSYFLFKPDRKKKLLVDYSFEKFKHNRKLSSEELFLFCHKKNKEFGEEVISQFPK